MWRRCLTKSECPFAAAQSMGVTYHHWSPVLSHLSGKYEFKLGMFFGRGISENLGVLTSKIFKYEGFIQEQLENWG